jgi:hypothetical protein
MHDDAELRSTLARLVLDDLRSGRGQDRGGSEARRAP